MFIVKRLGKNGLWSAVSLIDKNGSFRGEAKFETRREAEEYLAEYLKRMKDRLLVTAEGSGQLKIFEESYTKTVKSSKRSTASKE
jgi:hypothetical protein